jgi:histone arginine demethylase JMJD6
MQSGIWRYLEGAMTTTTANDAIPRCDAHDRSRLISEYFLKRKPVVVNGFADKWPALKKWRPEFFRERFPNVKRKIGDRVYTIAEYVDLMENSTPENPAPYPFNFDIGESFPDLIDDVKPHPVFGKVDRATHWAMRRSLYSGTKVHELFLGGEGSFFPVLHCDMFYLHGYVTQIYGDKEFFLYPPEQTPYMYARPDNPKLSQIANPQKPELDRFPLFSQARAVSTTVKPGETIFIPFGWWHYTRLHGPNIAYGGIGLNASNWPNFIDDVARTRAAVAWKSNAIRLYGKLAGAAMSVQEALTP